MRYFSSGEVAEMIGMSAKSFNKFVDYHQIKVKIRHGKRKWTIKNIEKALSLKSV